MSKHESLEWRVEPGELATVTIPLSLAISLQEYVVEKFNDPDGGPDDRHWAVLRELRDAIATRTEEK